MNLFLFLVILILGIVLRSQETISRNFVFLIDQGRDMMAVKSILYDHHLTLIGPYTSLQGVFQGPIWYYLLSVFTFLFGGDPWGSVGPLGVVTATFSNDPHITESMEKSAPILLMGGGVFLLFLF